LSRSKAASAQFAYLSAYPTAYFRDPHLGDEGIHIASHFLLAGFTHVIGMLWETEDETCQVLTKKFYQQCSRENASGVEPGMSTKHFITLFHNCYLRVDNCHYSGPHLFVLGGRIIEYNENQVLRRQNRSKGAAVRNQFCGRRKRSHKTQLRQRGIWSENEKAVIRRLEGRCLSESILILRMVVRGNLACFIHNANTSTYGPFLTQDISCNKRYLGM
jgi:CHAT domain